MTRQNKRKKLFVDRSVQGFLVGRVSLHWVCFFAILIALQVLSTWMVNPMLTRGELFISVMQNYGLFMLAAVLLLPSFIYDTVKMSNRFAGPMVRLKNEFQNVQETGELKEIQFRESDFWKDIAEKYNAMVRALNAKQNAEAGLSDPNVSASDPIDGAENLSPNEFDSVYRSAEEQLLHAEPTEVDSGEHANVAAN